MKDYTIVATLAPEAISLGADTKENAIAKARAIIAEQYGEGVANDATYQLEEESK